MKRIVTYLFIFTGWMSVASAQEIGTSPLEYSPEKFFRAYGEMVDRGTSKALYPMGSQNFYVYDTISLPFVDDFSTYRFKNYDKWGWQAPVDSVALAFRFDTLPAAFPFSYLLDTSYTYFIVDNTPNPPSVDSIQNPDYKVILYGDTVNPFIPVDTITVWEITSLDYRADPLNLTVDSNVIIPDGSFTADSTDTIQVYFPLSDSALWVDNFVYRNFSMGIQPPTIGVATFDGTDEFGRPYQPGAIGSFGLADFLTSAPIDLFYPPSDSIFLSFFYQSQGLGYEPDPKDSLVLEFYSPITEMWHHVLNIPGSATDTFRQTIVGVTDTNFLQDGFRFRFKNYSNLSGNLDHWNIDYVRLDRNRFATDTIIQDVAFVEPQNTILRRYMAMPYTQFTQPDIDPKWINLISNLSDVNKTISYKFRLLDESGTVLNSYTEDYPACPGDISDIQPVSVSGYATNPCWYEPDFNYNFQSAGWLPLTDSTEFYVRQFIQNFDVDNNPSNDTVVVTQRFHNYFAYDDGTAEQAIWLGTPGYVAVKFTNNFPDTLRAIQFYFNPIREDVTSRFFSLKVWTGDLETEVYSVSRQIGVIDGDPSAVTSPYNNGFTTYFLRDTAVVLPAGDFYVGWYQNQTYKINMGFDRNRDNSQYVFYKTAGVWDTLSLEGSVMIRPMVGPRFSLQDVGVEPLPGDEDLTVYPNPSSDAVYYTGEAAAHITAVELMDISGKVLIRQNDPVTNRIDVSAYPNGFYFLRFALEGSGRTVTRKIIVSH